MQYLGALELAGSSLAYSHCGGLAAFGLAQFDMIKYIHLGLLVGAPDKSTYPQFHSLAKNALSGAGEAILVGDVIRGGFLDSAIRADLIALVGMGRLRPA